MAGTKLVIGASGFLGSHVAKQLIARGERDVRVLIRPTSSTCGIDGLPVDVRYGDIFDTEALRAAMDGCDVVYYCVVDARPWLRDPRPLWRTNVDGLRNVLEVASDADLYRFVFTSSIGTIGLRVGGRFPAHPARRNAGCRGARQAAVLHRRLRGRGGRCRGCGASADPGRRAR